MDTVSACTVNHVQDGTEDIEITYAQAVSYLLSIAELISTREANEGDITDAIVVEEVVQGCKRGQCITTNLVRI